MTKILQDRSIQVPPHSKITYPTIPVGHPLYVWTSGADVQKTWSRFGWTPMNPIKPETVNVH